jgi:hypothetical protein
MSQPRGLFTYPPQAAVGRVLPKNKVYEHARPGSAVRALFVSQVEQIAWAYKLAPETVNLRATPGVPEIEIFELTLKTSKLDASVLRCIDKAIPFPILFQLRHEGRIQSIAAHKRPSDADARQWVVSDYLFAPWQADARARPPLPVALDLRGLYEQLLRTLMPVAARAGESLRDHVDRVTLLRGKQSEIDKLAARMAKEKQFNRKVELNAQLRIIRKELNHLTA